MEMSFSVLVIALVLIIVFVILLMLVFGWFGDAGGIIESIGDVLTRSITGK
jgi:hypothetical protein